MVTLSFVGRPGGHCLAPRQLSRPRGSRSPLAGQEDLDHARRHDRKARHEGEDQQRAGLHVAIFAGGNRPGTRRAPGGPSPDVRRPGSTVSRQGHGYTHAAFGWSLHRLSLSTTTGFPRVKERAEQLVGKARDAVPEGTFAVGGGLIVAAAT